MHRRVCINPWKAMHKISSSHTNYNKVKWGVRTYSSNCVEREPYEQFTFCSYFLPTTQTSHAEYLRGVSLLSLSVISYEAYLSLQAPLHHYFADIVKIRLSISPLSKANSRAGLWRVTLMVLLSLWHHFMSNLYWVLFSTAIKWGHVSGSQKKKTPAGLNRLFTWKKARRCEWKKND